MSFNQTPSAPAGTLNVPDSAYETMSPVLNNETVEQHYQALRGSLDQPEVYQTVQREQQPLLGSVQMVANQSPQGAPQQQAPPPNVPYTLTPTQQMQFRQMSIQPMIMSAQQQPVFVQQPAAAPGIGMGDGPAVYYVAQPQPGMGQVAMQMAPQSQSNFEYKPNSYRILSILTLVICGLFSPLSVACSIPALIFSLKSEKSYRSGLIKEASKNGVKAAYLIAIAVIFAMVVATVITGAVIPTAGAYQCISSGFLSNTRSRYSNFGPNYIGSCYDPYHY